MTDPAWVQEVTTGLGALITEMERARDAGDAVDWSSLVEKARGVGAKLEVATSDYKRIIAGANEKLASASLQIRGLHEHVQELQGQIAPPGVGAPKTGLGAGQTVYISAGATAGIAAGALLLGGVGGYAAKAMLDKRKKKAAEAKEAAEEADTEEEVEEPPKRIRGKVK